jgi:hypothetical protein
LLSIAGLGLFGLFWVLGVRLLSMIRPEMQAFEFRMSGLTGGIFFLASVVGLLLLTLTLHELVHGIFFWLFTGARAKFAWKWLYAYAAAPEWYIPRGQFLVVTAAPLVLITAAGLALLWVVPQSALLPVLFCVTVNASGAVGDIAAILWLVFQPRDALVNDTGDAICVYRKRLSFADGHEKGRS